MGSSASSGKIAKLNSPDICRLILLIKSGSPDVILEIKKIPNFQKFFVSEVIFKQNQWNLLHLASWFGNSQLCTELIKLGLDSNSLDNVIYMKHNETPLHLAACRGHYKAVKALLPTSDIKNCKNIKGQTPFDLASNGGHCKIAKLIGENMKDKLEISDLV